MKYAYRGPGHPVNTPVEKTVAELQKIKERDGGITASALVEESRPVNAPLHPEFEWDNAVAGEKYREVQARQIIRSVVLMPQPELHETLPVIRAFVSIHDPAGQTPQARIYKPTLETLRDPLEGEDVVNRCLRDVQQVLQKYKDILEVHSALKTQIMQMVEEVA